MSPDDRKALREFDALHAQLASVKALLAEARTKLDDAWATRPVSDVGWEPTDFRPLSVRTLLARIDARMETP